MCIVTLFHGSPSPDIKKLIPQNNPNNPFGSAIYCSRDMKTAECYKRNTGAIYTITTTITATNTINLSIPLHQQSSAIKKIILKTRKQLGLGVIADPKTNTRDLLHPDGLNRDYVNRLLVMQGVWVLCGYLDVYEHSGRKDDGLQYSILEKERVRPSRNCHAREFRAF